MIGDRLGEAVEGLDGVELVVGLIVAVLALDDLAVLDDRPGGDEGEADAALGFGAEAGDVAGDAAGKENLVHGKSPDVASGSIPPG